MKFGLFYEIFQSRISSYRYLKYGDRKKHAKELKVRTGEGKGRNLGLILRVDVCLCVVGLLEVKFQSFYVIVIQVHLESGM